MAPQVTVYGTFVPTPNPAKVFILLEELGVEYTTIPLEFGDGPSGVKNPKYLAVNPNGRVPAIVDHTNNDIVIWESGAIMFYVAQQFDKEGRVTGKTLEEKTQILQWMTFQTTSQGPNQGEYGFFMNKHLGDHPVVEKRHLAETFKVYEVLDKQLAANNGWLALDRYTIADMAHYPWMHAALFAGIDFSRFPHLMAWNEKMKKIPSVDKACGDMMYKKKSDGH